MVFGLSLPCHSALWVRIQILYSREIMFESAKNDLTQQVLFGERVKTLLFLSMAIDLPVTILLFKDGDTVDQGVLKTGVVKVVSGGSGPPWKRCLTGSFILKTDEDSWIEIQDVYAISFSEANGPVTFLKHKDTLIEPNI